MPNLFQILTCTTVQFATSSNASNQPIWYGLVVYVGLVINMLRFPAVHYWVSTWMTIVCGQVMVTHLGM